MNRTVCVSVPDVFVCLRNAFVAPQHWSLRTSNGFDLRWLCRYYIVAGLLLSLSNALSLWFGAFVHIFVFSHRHGRVDRLVKSFKTPVSGLLGSTMGSKDGWSIDLFVCLRPNAANQIIILTDPPKEVFTEKNILTQWHLLHLWCLCSLSLEIR